MKFFIYIMPLLLIACSTEKHAKKFFEKHPNKLAEECAAKFPVKDSIVVRDSISFDTIPGQAIVFRDTIPCKDSIIYRQHTCPPAATILKTIRHDSIIIRPDVAAMNVLKYQIQDRQRLISDYLQTIQDKNQELKAYQDRVRKLNWNIFWLIVALIGASCWIFRKPLLKLIA